MEVFGGYIHTYKFDEAVADEVVLDLVYEARDIEQSLGSQDTIRVFAISKLGWIRQQQKKLLEQDRETPREFLNRESHYLWGRRYLLKLVESDGPATIEVTPARLLLHGRPGWDQAKKQEVLDVWYRVQIKADAPKLIEKWERLMGVRVARFFVQHMKTKWGS